TTLWPNGQVPVCWETGPAADGSGDRNAAHSYPNFGNISAAVRSAAEEYWGRSANIHFVGWLDCLSNRPEGNPGTIAIHWNPGTGADSSNVGYFSGSWTRMEIDPTAFAADAVKFRGIVLHEFGHALGFNHEMDRPDWVIPKVGNPCIGNRQ